MSWDVNGEVEKKTQGHFFRYTVLKPGFEAALPNTE